MLKIGRNYVSSGLGRFPGRFALKTRFSCSSKQSFSCLTMPSLVKHACLRVRSCDHGLIRPFSSPSFASSDSSLNVVSNDYLEGLYSAWLADPSSVDPSWKGFFESQLPDIVRLHKRSSGETAPSGALTTVEDALHDPYCKQSIVDHMKVQLLVRAYRVRGHHRSQLDPLGILKPDLDFTPAPELDLSYYNLKESQCDEEFILGDGVLPFYRQAGKETMRLRDVLANLQKTYCGTIGFEYTHIPDREQCDWIRSRIEVPVKYSFSKEEKLRILDRLAWSDSFERFVHGKYPGEKRFGLEGCEALIPGMKELIDRSVEHGVESIVMGMPHRGRLNVLSNVVRKPNESIFCEFNGESDSSVGGSGDVKYHLGMNYERPTPSGKRVYLSLVANPSHLEAVNPVVQGKTKALQFYMNDTENNKAMGILLHGDAAFAAQGVVYESLGLSDLPSYSTGGTIHIVVNNQVGFTTDPRFARSTPYCTEVAKAISAPILHVNADDVEAVVWASQFAADWRQRYKKDVVIDLVCYRRHGHNEFDEPMFTQPRMYKAISKKKRVLDIYIEKLIEEGTMTQDEIDKIKKRVWEILETSYDQAKTYKPTVKEWLTSTWNGFKSPKELKDSVVPTYDTGISEETMKLLGKALATVPEDFDIHKGVAKILEGRRKAVLEEKRGEGGMIDYALAEALAFGSLLLEGNHVRLSGQDVERGTFSQRHAVLHDQSVERTYVPLSHLSPTQAKFTVCNSSLSEFGILGFELGYSLVNPRSLICWEAQFGDFANNAQCIIDQFLVCGERKWIQRSGLTMLLPHGFDGNGPEHSSARLERFLQLCDDDAEVFPDFEPSRCRQIQDCNIQVVYPSTPANYFHALRRQVCRDFRKPLIVMNSKALLRHPMARSSLSEFVDGTRFQRAYGESQPDFLYANADRVKTILFCSGQVYYPLVRAREANGLRGVAIARVEQISPFPFDRIVEIIDSYPKATRIVWVQEEPINMGAWTYVQPRFWTAMRNSKHHSNGHDGVSHMYDLLSAVARPPSAAVATGLKKQHHSEEEDFLSRALLGQSLKAKKTVQGSPVWDIKNNKD